MLWLIDWFFAPHCVTLITSVFASAVCLCVQVGVSIQMSSFNLTRIVTMSPFYTLVNKSSYELEVGEVISQTATRWHYISTTEVNITPFHLSHLQSLTESTTMRNEEFNYNSQKALLRKMSSQLIRIRLVSIYRSETLKIKVQVLCDFCYVHFSLCVFLAFDQ